MHFEGVTHSEVVVGNERTPLLLASKFPSVAHFNQLREPLVEN